LVESITVNFRWKNVLYTTKLGGHIGVFILAAPITWLVLTATCTPTKYVGPGTVICWKMMDGDTMRVRVVIKPPKRRFDYK
jgi:hypothetical protein